MKAILFSVVCGALALGCATNDGDAEQLDDLDSKADGAVQLTGLYTVVRPSGGFRDEAAYMMRLDLRSDGTYYENEVASFDAGDGNFEEGERTSFGTFEVTRDTDGTHYLVFSDSTLETSWSWEFTSANHGATLHFYWDIYEDDNYAFDMRREPRPTTTFVNHVKAKYPTSTRTTLDHDSIGADGIPESVYARFEDEYYAERPVTAARFYVDSRKVYAIELGEGDARSIEVYANNGQLIARSATASPLTWSSLRP
jgi:hypothetical protein